MSTPPQRSEPEWPWARPGRCDFCPSPADLHAARCACGRHEVGVQACARKHLDFLHEGELACRACQCDLPEQQRHICLLAPAPDRPVRMADPARPDAITCPRCGMTSYSPGDAAYRYCGNCHLFHDQMGLDG
jgi:hypothetical protein